MSCGCFFMMALPGLSTTAFASLRPTPRRVRTTFRMEIFFALGTSLSTRSNSVFSGSFSSSAAGAAAIMTAPELAEASTPNVSSIALTSSEASNSVSSLRVSTIWSVFSDCMATLGVRAARRTEMAPGEARAKARAGEEARGLEADSVSDQEAAAHASATRARGRAVRPVRRAMVFAGVVGAGEEDGARPRRGRLPGSEP
mmetsp:Transcript_56555/g.160517  ORF Transcript_56555/g.160517 Transcript_56555/m.160517 type:complete len:200 (-) Transcript_56555:2-601(-)